ncbi:MAG: hypothetical protein R3D63_13915 [Paracoccaceae bacterium]
MLRALFLAALTLACGAAAWAEAAAAEGEVAEPLPYVEVPVVLNEVEYLAVIDTSGAESVQVNGEELDLAPHVPGAVRISRADGASMADEGFRAREVIRAACATQGKAADQAVVPVLTPGGRWIFAGGACDARRMDRPDRPAGGLCCRRAAGRAGGVARAAAGGAGGRVGVRL